MWSSGYSDMNNELPNELETWVRVPIRKDVVSCMTLKCVAVLDVWISKENSDEDQRPCHHLLADVREMCTRKCNDF